MFGLLVILFTVLPAVELWLLIKVGTVIGAGNTILLIIATGICGAYLARTQGFFITQKIQREMAQGRMPTSEMIDGLMVLVGGIVLLTPGIITDVLGLMLLIPFTRSLIKLLVRAYMKKMVDSGQVHVHMAGTHQQSRRKDRGQGTIDVDGREV